MVELRKYDVNQEVFEKILELQSHNIRFVPTIDPYRGGYRQRNIIYYDGKEYLVILEYMLEYIAGKDVCDDLTMWRQCIVRKINNQVEEVESGVTGLKAWNYVNKILKKYYSVDEIEERLNMFTAEYNDSEAQYHYLLPFSYQKLTFDNCYKYDINGAHNDALKEIFPKAADAFIDLFNKRHDFPKYKSYVNYYVGFLCKRGHRLTYNWIVQRTNNILQESINKVNGTLLYANTDGFIVENPECLIEHSKELGQFKLEYQGQVRFYRDVNWYAYEIDSNNEDKRVTGNIRLVARKELDLKHDYIVHYDVEKNYINDKDYIYVTKNIVREKLNKYGSTDKDSKKKLL